MDSSQLSFAWPWLFLLLPLPLLARYLLPPLQQATAALTVPFFEELKARQATEQTRRTMHVTWLALFAWLLLVTATAGPTWYGDPIEIPTSGRNVMLAVDLSGSMAIEDLTWEGQPVDRLVVVKHVLNDFIARRQGDRLGLILFGTHAYLQTPLTYDLDTVQAMMDESEIALPGPQTAIGDTIGLAIKRLQDLEEESRVLILLTDGANNSGVTEPIQAAKLAALKNIRIHTIGLGADQMVVPGLFGSRVVNPSYDIDEQALQDIADITGGEYFRAKDSDSLERIYTLIDELEPVESDPDIYRPVTELYPWPLAAALLLSLLLLWQRARHV